MILSSITRFAISGPVAALVTFALFQLMHALISRPVTVPEPEMARVLLPITPQPEDPATETVKPPQPDVLDPPPLPDPIQSTIEFQDGPVFIPESMTTIPQIRDEMVPGGEVSVLANRGLQMLNPALPVFPDRAQRAGREGVCDVTIDVDPRGNPFNISAICSDNLFRQEAIRAVENVRFIPAVRDWKAVTSRGVVIPIEFALED